jgi:hypothetical protein
MPRSRADPRHDYLDGGIGTDIAVYSGPRADYSITENADGSYSVDDLRAGAPNGNEIVANIDLLQFSDGSVTLAGGVGTTISTSTTAGITLSSPPDTSPVVIESGVSVTSSQNGVYAATGPWTIQNEGTITGHFDGVNLLAGGTVSNAGTITGSGGTAVYLGGTGSNLLVVRPGAVFNGNVVGSASASNTLELAAGSSTGTLSGLGSNFANFGTLTVDGGATWELTGTNTIAAGTTLTNDGTLIDEGMLTDADSISGGISVGSGGVLTNAAGGTIAGGFAAVYRVGGPATVNNSGHISGSNFYGVYDSAGGSVTNATSAASIIGGIDGVATNGRTCRHDTARRDVMRVTRSRRHAAVSTPVPVCGRPRSRGSGRQRCVAMSGGPEYGRVLNLAIAANEAHSSMKNMFKQV